MIHIIKIEGERFIAVPNGDTYMLHDGRSWPMAGAVRDEAGEREYESLRNAIPLAFALYDCVDVALYPYVSEYILEINGRQVGSSNNPVVALLAGGMLAAEHMRFSSVSDNPVCVDLMNCFDEAIIKAYHIQVSVSKRKVKKAGVIVSANHYLALTQEGNIEIDDNPLAALFGVLLQ